MLRKNRIIPIAIFFIPLLTYLATLYPTVPSEDGGELITAAYTLGIAHPPGYPLLSIIGKIFTAIIPFGNIAWRTNVMSAILSALTVLLTYQLVKKITAKNLNSNLATESIAIFTSLLLAFSDIFWSQAIRMEAYALNSFFMIAIFNLLYSWHLKPDNKKILYITAFCIGLAATNHQIALLIAPATAIFVALKNIKVLKSPKLWAIGIITFFLGLSIYAYMPIRSAANPALDWGNTETSANFWAHLTRSKYAERAENNSAIAITPDASAPFQSQEEINQNPISSFFKFYIVQYARVLKLFIKNIFIQLFYLPALLAFLTIFLIFKKEFREQNPFASILPLALIFLIFPFHSQLDLNLDLPANRPFYLPAIITMTLSLSYSLIWLFKKITSTKLLKPISIILILLTAIPLIQNFTPNNQSKNFLSYDIAKATLNYLPENAILYISGDDNRIFPLLYLQEIEKIRPDIQIYNNPRSALDKYPLWTNWPEIHEQNPNTPIFTDAYTEPATDFVYAPHTPFAIEMTPKETNNPEATKTTQQQVSKIFDSIPCRPKSATNLDYENQKLASTCYFQKAINLINFDDSASQDAFELGISASRNRIEDLQDIYPYYYVAHVYNYEGMYHSAVNYLQRGLSKINNPAIAEYLNFINQKINANPL